MSMTTPRWRVVLEGLGVVTVAMVVIAPGQLAALIADC
jgi:hypothetical protein